MKRLNFLLLATTLSVGSLHGQLLFEIPVEFYDGSEESGPNFGLPVNNALILQMSDLDNDDRQDFIVLSSNNFVHVFYGTEEGISNTFQPIPVSSSTESGLVLIDIDDNGYKDLIISNRNNNDLGIIYNNGNRTYETSQRFKFIQIPREMELVDIDNNDILNVAVYNFGDAIYFFEPDDNTAGINNFDLVKIDIEDNVSDMAFS